MSIKLEILRTQPRWFSWSSKWAEAKLWFYRHILWKLRPISKYDFRSGVRIVTKCWRCGKSVSIKYVESYYIGKHHVVSSEIDLKDLRGVTEAEYFPRVKQTEAALDERMKREIR